MKTLNTHKGTVVRAILEFENGIQQYIEPLHDSVGGIVLDNRKFNHASKLEISGSGTVVISDSGVSLQPFTCDSRLLRLEAFVIYPDGSTWQGSVGKDLENVFDYLWGDKLIQSMVNKEVVANFYGNYDWKKIPTTLILYGESLTGAECHREHACGKQCE